MVWKKIWNFTSKCPTLKFTWTKFVIFWIPPKLIWQCMKTWKIKRNFLENYIWSIWPEVKKSVRQERK